MSSGNYVSVINRVEKHLASALETYGCDWFFIAVQGSYNYNLNDAQSDIDTKLLAIPSLDEIALGKKPINTVHIMDNGEHCEIKDVRLYFKTFRKQNINFVEVLFSEYVIVNPKYARFWDELYKHREELARMNPYAAVACIQGMSWDKRSKLCHKSEATEEAILKFGYVPKELHHLWRLNFVLPAYIQGLLYGDCLRESHKPFTDILINCKRNGNNRSLSEANAFADELLKQTDALAKQYRAQHKNEENEEYRKLLDDICIELIKSSILKNL